MQILNKKMNDMLVKGGLFGGVETNGGVEGKRGE
jgi:hypothetical protein